MSPCGYRGKSATDSDLISAIPIGSRPPLEGWQALDRWAVLGALLVTAMTSGGTDASRESVDATSTRDPAAQTRMSRHRPGDCPVAERRAQHRRADAGAGRGGGSALAIAGDADRPRAGDDAVCRPRSSAGRAAQGGARLGLYPSRAAPPRRHADAAVGGVRQREPDGYLYSRWRELYRAWESRLSPTIRQAHPAGERMFVDYAGQTIGLAEPARSGQPRSSSR